MSLGDSVVCPHLKEYVADQLDFWDRLHAPGDSEYDFYFGAEGHTPDEASKLLFCYREALILFSRIFAGFPRFLQLHSAAMFETHDIRSQWSVGDSQHERPTLQNCSTRSQILAISLRGHLFCAGRFRSCNAVAVAAATAKSTTR